jgi:hypothetical protein
MNDRPPAADPARLAEARERLEGRTTVLFIGGYARSGSTLLDCVLGQVPGAFSVGELEFIWTRGMRRNEPCGCGKAFLDCPFWTAVRGEAFGRDAGAVDVEAAAALHRSVERIRNIPGMASRLLRGETLGRELQTYGAMLAALYAAIRSVSGCDVIIDSSKDPVHGVVLRTLDGIDVRFVHLVRDSRAVAFSLQRTKSRAPGSGSLRRLRPARAALGWNLSNGMMHALIASDPRGIRVRYEDFVGAPRDVLSAVASRAGIHAADLGFVRDGGVRLSVNHTVSGNPSRFRRGFVRLDPDTEWRDEMSTRDRRVVTGLTWPLLVAYRYLRPSGAMG